MRIAIVEDEQDSTLELHALLQKLDSHSITLFPGGEQFSSAQEGQPYDFMSPDIQTEGMSGLKIVHKVQEKGAHTYLVSLTNDPPFAFKGYEVNAACYWLKPVQEEKFYQFLDRLEAPKTYLLWSVDEEPRKLYKEDIHYLGSDTRYMRYHRRKGIFRTKGNFQRECARLSDDPLNCHRSYRVNLNHVHALREDGCALDNQECIPVSRGMKQRIQEETIEHYKRGLLCRFRYCCRCWPICGCYGSREMGYCGKIQLP